jgi:hypothetical protein
MAIAGAKLFMTIRELMDYGKYVFRFVVLWAAESKGLHDMHSSFNVGTFCGTVTDQKPKGVQIEVNMKITEI